MDPEYGHVRRQGHLILRDGTLIVVTGRKGSGKSEYLKLLFRSYPYDKLVSMWPGMTAVRDGVFELQGDVTTLRRNGRGPAENGTGRWEPMTLRYEPDAGSATYREDMGRDPWAGSHARYADFHAGITVSAYSCTRWRRWPRPARRSRHMRACSSTDGTPR